MANCKKENCYVQHDGGDWTTKTGHCIILGTSSTLLLLLRSVLPIMVRFESMETFMRREDLKVRGENYCIYRISELVDGQLKYFLNRVSLSNNVCNCVMA